MRIDCNYCDCPIKSKMYREVFPEWANQINKLLHLHSWNFHRN